MSIRDEILQHTRRGYDVLCYYLGFQAPLQKLFRNPFYKDNKASCNIYFDQRGNIYRMKDFGNSEYSGDCFGVVARHLGMDSNRDFQKVASRIILDMGLPIMSYSEKPLLRSAKVRVSPAVKYQVNPELPVQTAPGVRPYTVSCCPFTADTLDFWKQYGIDKETLERYKVYPAMSFKSVNASGKPYKIIASKEEPMFVYDLNGCVKIYRPKSGIRFLYGGAKPKDYVFGLEQLPGQGDRVFLTGGEKDVLTLASHGFAAISLNSESSHLSKELLSDLSSRFEKISILYDMDETGVRCSKALVEEYPEYHLDRVELPLAGTKSDKDVSDFFRKNAASALTQFKNILSPKPSLTLKRTFHG